MNTSLTPYDQGTVLEPKPWHVQPRNLPDQEEVDRYGRVDFDTDEGSTTIMGLRCLPHDAGSENGQPILSTIIEFSTGDDQVVIRCLEPSTKVIVEGRDQPTPTEAAVAVVLENYGPTADPGLWGYGGLDDDADPKHILDHALSEGHLDGDGILAMLRAAAEKVSR